MEKAAISGARSNTVSQSRNEQGALPLAIEFLAVSKTAQRGVVILDAVNLQIKRGETLVLLGRSGSGKTTTLKLINRLLDPTSGEIRVENRPTTDWDPIRLRRHIGYVIQETGLFPHFTVARNVALVPRLEEWAEDRIDQRVRELLTLVGLDYERFAGRYPRELSGGQRQRVGVARALAADPPIILMDEPFGALDPLTRAELQSEFAALSRKLNKTIVFVTHDVREAFLLGSRIGLFKDGRLVELATPDEFARSQDPEAVAFCATLND
jgi:osmoprotectant transport system ATP-binding protein